MNRKTNLVNKKTILVIHKVALYSSYSGSIFFWTSYHQVVQGKGLLQRARPKTLIPKSNNADRLETKPNEGGATPGGDETAKEKDPEAEQPVLKNFTASQLLNHNKFLVEVEELKNGTITEGEFLGGLQQSQKQGLFHMMEKRSAAENENWKQMVGPGSKKKKNTQLLQFLRQGGLTQSHVEQKANFAQGWNATKDVEWVSWKKVCEQYGEQEATTVQRQRKRA